MCRLLLIITGLLFAASAATAAPPEALPDPGWRTTLLVLPFEAPGQAQQGAMADDYLLEALAGLGRFTLIERQKLDTLLLEQKLSREKLTSPDRSVRVGRLLAADQMLHGRIEELGGETVVTLRMVATATSATRDYSASAPAGGMRGFRLLIAGLAAKVAADFPVVSGTVTGTTAKTVTGSFAGQQPRSGLEVVVYRPGEPVRHPETGRILGRRSIRIATGTISAVGGKEASIAVLQTDKGRRITRGDLVVTK